MTSETVSVPVEEYKLLKKKEVVADDILLQLDSSLRDLENSRVKQVR